MANKPKSTPFIRADNRYNKNSDSNQDKELFPFPNRDMNPDNKGKAYHRKWAEAIYSIYISGDAAWSVNMHSQWERQRSYSRGEQDVEQYKKYLLDEQREEGSATSIDDMPISRVAKREGWLNVLWENLSIGPKIMDSMHGMFDPVDFDLYVDAIDSNSMSLQENAKYVALIEGMNQQWQIEYKKKAGIPVDENVILPKSNQELAAIEAAGGFKLNIAKSMEKLARHSFNASRWDDVIKKKLVDDLVTIGRCATRDRYDQEDGMFKTEYIDPDRLVIQYSKEHDYSDADYGGYFRLMTISDIKKKMPHLTDEELRKIAQSSRGLFGNPSVPNRDDWDRLYDRFDETTHSYGWYDFKVSVFDAAWMDWDLKRAKKYQTKSGRSRYERVPYDEEIPDKYESVTSTWRCVRQCTWIVGTKHTFDDGKMNMGARPQPNKPRLPFHVERLHGPSIIKRTIPIMDQISLLWFRYQNSMAKMIESGFAVDFGMIMNISDGQGKKYDVNQILKMWKQTGILPFMPSRYGNYQGGAVTPVHALPSDFMSKLEGIMAAFEFQFRMFEQTTGINPISLGQTPSPDAPVGTTEASMQATSNIIKPIATAIFELKQNAGECMVSRIQTGIRVSDNIRKAYEGIVGKNDIMALKMAEKSNVRYGLSMKAKPDQLFKQKLVSYIEIALASGRDGKAGIEINDAILLEEKLWRGDNISDIRNELSYIIERRKQEIAMEKNALIKSQSEENQKLEGMQQQGEMARHKMDMQKIVVTEEERRRTERVIANREFLAQLIEQSNKEKAEGGITDETHDRLRLAMNVLARVGDESTINLAAEVGKLERGIAQDQFDQPATPQPNTMPLA